MLTNVRILIPMNIPHNPTPISNSERLSQQILKIDEVTTDVSLSAGTSPTTETHNALNSRIFALTGGQTQHLRCYWGSCNHYTIGPFAKGIVCGWVFGSLHWQKISSSPLKKKFFFLAVFGLGNSVHLLGKVIRHYYAKPSPGVVGWGDDTWDYGKSNLYH